MNATAGARVSTRALAAVRGCGGVDLADREGYHPARRGNLTLSTKIPPVGTVEDQHLHELIENYLRRGGTTAMTTAIELLFVELDRLCTTSRF